MLNVLIVMEQIRYMIMMMAKDSQMIANYAIKKDILILLLLNVPAVIILEKYGLLRESEDFQKNVKIVKEKVIYQERN